MPGRERPRLRTRPRVPHATESTETYTLSLHDALPISSDAAWCRTWPTRHRAAARASPTRAADRKSTRLNSSHVRISYAVFCLKKKKVKATTVAPTCTHPATTRPHAHAPREPGVLAYVH